MLKKRKPNIVGWGPARARGWGAEGSQGWEGDGGICAPHSPLAPSTPVPRLNSGKQNYLIVFILWSVQSLCPCVCVNERFGGVGEHYMGVGEGDPRPGSGLGAMTKVRGQGPGL